MTLLEVLVTASIVGILAATAVPTFQTGLLRAKVASAENDLRIISDALEVFATDTGRYPHGSTEPPTKYNTDYDARIALAPLLGSYLPKSASMLDDHFTARAVAEMKDSIAYDPDGIPSLFGYSYFDYANFLVPPREPDMAYAVVSFGPDEEDSGLGLAPLPGIGKLFRHSAYSSSNGLRSQGDLGRFGGEF